MRFSQKFHKQYLLVSAIAVMLFGPVFFLGAFPGTSGIAGWIMDMGSWPPDGAQNFNASTTRFVSAIASGFLFGWGVCILGLRQWVYDLAPEGVRKSVLLGIVTWFLFDSIGSIGSGHPSNALSNVFFLLLAVGPLWWKART